MIWEEAGDGDECVVDWLVESAVPELADDAVGTNGKFVAGNFVCDLDAVAAEFVEKGVIPVVVGNERAFAWLNGDFFLIGAVDFGDGPFFNPLVLFVAEDLERVVWARSRDYEGFFCVVFDLKIDGF